MYLFITLCHSFIFHLLVAHHGTVEVWQEEMRLALNGLVQIAQGIVQVLYEIKVERTGKTLADIERDTDRDNFLSADAAAEYGLIDKVIEKRP